MLPILLPSNDVSPACVNPNNDIIVEPINDVNASNVEVAQAEVFIHDKYNSNNDRKLPASKNYNDDEDDSDDDRKMPACKTNNNDGRISTAMTGKCRHETIIKMTRTIMMTQRMTMMNKPLIDKEQRETFPPQCAAVGNSIAFLSFLFGKG